jgi:hypothetical protein
MGGELRIPDRVVRFWKQLGIYVSKATTTTCIYIKLRRAIAVLEWKLNVWLVRVSSRVQLYNFLEQMVSVLQHRDMLYLLKI